MHECETWEAKEKREITGTMIVTGTRLLEASAAGSQLVGDASVLQLQALELVPDGMRVLKVVAIAGNLRCDPPRMQGPRGFKEGGVLPRSTM
jgi:hypothetical protein